MASNNKGLVILSKEVLQKFRNNFAANSKNVLAQNVCARFDPLEVCINRARLQDMQHVFEYKVDIDGKPVTHQKSSGRCWIFAALNTIRLPLMKHYNIEEFEFSQAHLYFWDKVERSNFFLNTVIKVFKRGETLSGRLMTHLLKEPNADGGQWDMLVNLISKYGLIPKKYFPESFVSENTHKLRFILYSKLREYAKVLHNMLTNNATEENIQDTIKAQMEEVYRIVAICLGEPPLTFTWEYLDKNKQYHCMGPMTSCQFYTDVVQPLYNIHEKVCLISDPRPGNPYHQLYTVDCLNNMVDGKLVLYNNQPADVLMKAAADSIKQKEAVWFGCEVSKRYFGKAGLEDLCIHDYQLLFDADISLPLSKAERLLYGESAMSHAMVLTGFSEDEFGQPLKWRVENSWGEDSGFKGYLLMTNTWFREFVFEVVVDRRFLSPEVLSVLETNPITMPAWDPMGALAINI